MERSSPLREYFDPRIQSRWVKLNGINYRTIVAPIYQVEVVDLAIDYLFAESDLTPRATVFLLHGWPDLSAGWRHQIPMLLQLGFRVVAPDLIGYGQTDAPRVPPDSIAMYSFKRTADDMRELARQLSISQIILGGHDWGGAIVFRIAIWYPDLVTHIFSICTPYTAPSKSFTPLEVIVKSGRLPNFGYQLQLASGQLEDTIQSKEQIRQLLNALFGGRTSTGEPGFDVEHGIHLDRLHRLEDATLVGEEMLDYYANQYALNGIHGTLNWYRNREQNHRDELVLEKKTIDIPVLHIAATKDEALPPSMSKAMDRYIPQLTRKSVDTHHWALWEKPDEVNHIIHGWLESVIPRRASHL